MRFRICFGFFMILWMLSLSLTPSFSTTYIKMTFEELVKEADYIIIGTVKGNKRHTEEQEEAGRYFYVYVDILVEKVIKSSKRSSSSLKDKIKEELLPVLKEGAFITLRELDPTKAIVDLRVRDGERAIWFLKSDLRKTGYFYVLGNYQGKFLIENDIAYENVGFMPPDKKEEYELATLKDFLKQIKATMKVVKKRDVSRASRQLYGLYGLWPYEQDDPEKRKWFFYNGSRQKEHLRIETDKFVIIYKKGVSEREIEEFHKKHRMEVLSRMERERGTSPPSSPLLPAYLVTLPKSKRLKDVLTPFGKQTDSSKSKSAFWKAEIIDFTLPAFKATRKDPRIVEDFIFTDEISLKLRPYPIAEAELAKFNKTHHIIDYRTEHHKKYPGYYLLRLTSKSDLNTLDMANLYQQHSFVEWASPTVRFTVRPRELPNPNDEYYNNLTTGAKQWHLNSDNDIDIDAPKSWKITKGSPDIVIAIVDSGIQLDHPDLQNKLIETDVGNFVPSQTHLPPNDSHGHGTRVAGIAGAQTDNGMGIAGVGWNCMLLPVKIFEMFQAIGNVDASTASLGIRYAADKAQIINLSWGVYTDYPEIRDAIEYATATKQRIVVCAAGNDSSEVLDYPSDYKAYFLGVIRVGGMNVHGEAASWSNYMRIDVIAPAENLITTTISSAYTFPNTVWGNSYAASQVSGVAALIWSIRPTLSANWILGMINAYADENRKLNAFKAVRFASGPTPADPPPGPVPLPGNQPAPVAAPAPPPLPAGAAPAPVPHAVKPTHDVELEREKSIAALRSFVQKYPNYDFYTPSAMFELAFNLELQGKTQEAIAQLDEIIQKFPYTQTAINAKLKKGEIYLKNKDYLQALTAFESALENPVNEDEIIDERSYQGMKTLEEKIKPAALYMMVLTHVRMGNYGKAWKIYRRLKSEYPKETYTEMARRQIIGER